MSSSLEVEAKAKGNVCIVWKAYLISKCVVWRWIIE
jgi:hypothetical protein